MESRRYQKLNPLALAAAFAVTSVVISFFIGLPMMGFGGMMGGRYGMGWMMDGYGIVGFGLMWIVGALIAALAGAIVAWVYNAVDAGLHKEADGTGQTGSQFPTAR